MKNTAFYILAVLVIVLCVVGACITAAPTGESGADAATGQTSPSGGQSGSGESSENGTSSAEVSREPYIPPDPSVYPTVTDADIGPDEIDSFSYHNNLAPVSADSVHPLYQGEKMKIEDAVAAMGAKTVYLSGMALNELALFGAEASVSNLAAVADAVKAKSPDARIVVLANTYRTRDFNDSRNKLNNAGISEYNNLLLDYCNENGFDFVDVATPLMENGCLADKFCSDNDKSNSNCLGCHLTTDAYAIWTAVLRDYARAKQAGVYVNPDSMPLYGQE